MRHLILGSGPAGVAAALAAKEADRNAEVVVVTEDTFPSYYRPAVPDLVAGAVEPSGIVFSKGKEMAAAGIRTLYGKRVRRVNTANNRVIFTDGSEEDFNFLCVATGGRPLLPPALQAAGGSFLTLNSAADAMRLRAHALRADSVLVYGPGYLGIEASRAIRRLGVAVTWINPGLPRFGSPISGEVQQKASEALRGRGVTVLEGTDLADVIDLEGRAWDVIATSGQKIRCSLIVVATERTPSVSFLEGSGIRVGTGVLVDEYLHTNISNIFAAGDCAEVFDINRRVGRINFGWNSALKQGELAGANMAGGGNMYIRTPDEYFGRLQGVPLQERLA